MKPTIWTRDWFAALAFALVFALLAFGVLRDGFQGLERDAYDLGVRARDRAPSDRVAVIAIDDTSIENLGRWPWPRSLHAAMVDLLRDGGAKAVGSTVFYFEPQEDPGLRYLSELAQWLENSPLATALPEDIERLAGAELGGRYRQELQSLQERLAAAGTELSVDRRLAQSLGEGPASVLALSFRLGEPLGPPDRALPDYVRRHALTRITDRVGARDQGWLPVPSLAALYPIPELGTAAAGLGHLSLTLDVDGALRFEPLVLRHYDELYPSLALMLAARALNLSAADIEVRLGEGIALGGLTIPTTTDLRMYPHFYQGPAGRPPFSVDSFYDVLSGRIPVQKYRDKIVLIGASAVGVGDAFPTPVSPSMPPVESLAHTLSSILQQDFYVRPDWAGGAEFLLYLAVTAYLALLLPRLGPALAAGITAVLAIGLLTTQLTLLARQALWVQFVIPVLLLVLGHVFMTVKRLRLVELLKRSSEAESAESNRMLGLAFQGQGQLDMAFEKFRRVKPVDDKLLDLLYNLALDFERKRQFNKAESVYQHIAQHQRDYRDIQQKLSRARKLSETVILGGNSSHPGGTMVLDASSEKPMLGRYQVEKELGKGAMGVVYMGKDPKINRTVAIKTMALSQEFEADELDEVKGRFFREAETAGRLNHPNIVQIYDAGEEHDLCYIAMEFLRGHDLTRHSKPNTLLPVPDVLRIVADAADALDYAHEQGVVHRDVKPANLMWLPDARVVKVTDFGIARITDSSKTKTGMVLGTPSYMSPEQLAGRKVDGRSDLFSLGVTLFQLLTGSLPFQAESMATLMYKIANEPHPRPTLLRPDLPSALDGIVEKSMAKDLEQRYARGRDLARDLRFILASAAA